MPCSGNAQSTSSEGHSAAIWVLSIMVCSTTPSPCVQQGHARASRLVTRCAAYLLLLQGVLINRGWEVEGAADSNAVTARLAKLPLPQLCPAGFVFAWADKAHVRSPFNSEPCTAT